MWLIAAGEVPHLPLFAKEFPAPPERAPSNNVQGRQAKADDANGFARFQTAKRPLDRKGAADHSFFGHGLRKSEFLG